MVEVERYEVSKSDERYFYFWVKLVSRFLVVDVSKGRGKVRGDRERVMFRIGGRNWSWGGYFISIFEFKMLIKLIW